MKLSKVLNIVLWVLLGISAVFIVSLISNISDNKADAMMGSWINTNLVWVYILLGISIIFVLVGGLGKMLSDKKAAKNGLMALVAMALIVVVAYVVSQPDIPKFYGVEKFIANGSLTGGVSRWIGTGLVATYILFLIAILSIVGSSISRLFK